MTARKGWAWGSRIPSTSPWLTIAGSHCAHPHLAGTPADATPHPTNIVGDVPVLALVEVEDGYFRIIELAEEAR
jgi:hypothetical protein